LIEKSCIYANDHLQVKASDDGRLIIDVPAPPNQAFEVVLVLQPIQNQNGESVVEMEEVDAHGWTIGFFERTYSSFADNPIEIDRGEDLPQEERDEIE